MNIDQQKIVMSLIDECVKGDYVNKFIAAHANKNKLASRKAFASSDFVFTINKLFRVFKFSENVKELVFVPSSMSGTEYGGITVQGSLSELNGALRAGNEQTAILELKKLVHFCMVNGIWRDVDVEGVIQEKIREVETNSAKIESGFKRVSEIRGEAERIQKELLNGIEVATNSLNKSEVVVSKMDAIAESVREKRDQSLLDFEKAFISLRADQEKIEAFRESLEALEKSQKAKLEEIALSFKKVETSSSAMTDYLAFAEKANERIAVHLSFFEEREKIVNALIGKEAGAHLFGTFKERKTELKGPYRFWGWMVALTTTLLFALLYYLFTPENIKDSDSVKLFFVTFKTVPVVIFLLFALSQYRKERNIHEEYAFKASVALTVDAFAKLVVDQSVKDTLIRESVTRIYEVPISVEQSTSKRNLKSLTSVLKEINEITGKLYKKSSE